MQATIALRYSMLCECKHWSLLSDMCYCCDHCNLQEAAEASAVEVPPPDEVAVIVQVGL